MTSIRIARSLILALSLTAGFSCHGDDAPSAAADTDASAQPEAAASGASSGAADGTVVLIPASIPYAEDAANDAIRSSCSFPTYLPQQVIAAAKRYNITVQTSDADLSTLNSGRVLQIKTLYLYGLGGGGYSGAKSARIRGELRQDGKVVGDFTMQRDTKGGLVNWTACGALERDADALGRDVARWLNAPQMGTRQGVR